MTLAPALLLLALADSPAPAAPSPAPAAPAAQAPAAPAKPAAAAKAKPGAKGARVLTRSSLPSVEGEVTAIDHRAHRLTLQAAAGELVLSFDRDTFVTGPAGAETPLQITPGLKVKVGRDGDARAAWVELPAAPSTPKPAP
ncbi:MAG TPA: hypothetical protein VLT61_06095 [Anaeromyxobacteraceae bacterium]|nr:hypothetical protein [Anaeromyxobacteraceae bacterium]